MACDCETFSRAGLFISGRQPPIHRENDGKNYKEENHIKCLEWPPQSPGLSVVENVWLKLKIRLQQRV
jgi:transposase